MLGSQKQQWFDSITSSGVISSQYWFNIDVTDKITGWSSVGGTNANISLVNFSSNTSANTSQSVVSSVANGSALNWSKIYNSSYTNNSLILESVATDSGGNTYVVGDFISNSSVTNAAVIKFDPTGSVLWAKQYQDTYTSGATKTTFNAVFYGVNISPAGNLIVAGETNYDPSGTTPLVSVIAQLNTNDGSLKWANNFNGGLLTSGQGFDYISFDTSDNIYLRTTLNGPIRGLVKLNSVGSLQWQNFGWGNSGFPDGANYSYISTVGADNSGNVLVGATNSFTSNTGSGLLIQTNTSGNIAWAKQLWNSNYDRILPTAVAFDSSNNAYVVGDAYINGSQQSSYDMFVTKINSSGSIQWARTINDTKSSVDDEATTISLTANNQMIISGVTAADSTGATFDGIILSLPMDGSDTGYYNGGNGAIINYSPITFTSNTSNAIFKTEYISSVTNGGAISNLPSLTWNTAYPNLVTTVLPGPVTISAQYLVVAGGGGGGANNGAGGGAGGLLSNTASLIPGTVYSITVGAGGPNTTSGDLTGTTGSNSVFGAITALGGGGGGSPQQFSGYSGKSGGSGGGSAGTASSGGAGTSGQGYAGGISYNNNASPWAGGGGGGAGGGGSNGTNTAGGYGGIGQQSSITGSVIYYAGGGAGGVYNVSGVGQGGSGGGGNGGSNNTSSTAGSTNTGGGGGGGGSNGSGLGTASSGGSGVVIISIPTSYYTGITTGSPTVTTNGSNTVLTFTSSGTYTA
jgi:hypothetical protein